MNAEHSPDEPIDDEDRAVLDALAAVVGMLDPVPEGLVDRALFAITLESLHAEVMELQKVETAGAGVRSGSDSMERELIHARTITFSCEPVTVMINLSESPTGGLCIDGWVAPADRYTIELYRPGEREPVESDDGGAFVLFDVPYGPACLALRRADGTGPTVCTPVIEL